MGGIPFNSWSWLTRRCIGQSAVAAIASVPTGRPLPLRCCVCGRGSRPDVAAEEIVGLNLGENGEMPSRIHAVIFGLLLVMAGCKSADNSAPVTSANAPAVSSPAAMTSPTTPGPAGPATSAVKAKVDVCALLISDDLKNVQGEAFKEAQRSDRRDGEFIVAQCYYSLPTTSNSVVLNVTTANEGQSPRSPRVFWETTFGRDEV